VPWRLPDRRQDPRRQDPTFTPLTPRRERGTTTYEHSVATIELALQEVTAQPLWMVRAKCRHEDTNIFFPRHGASTAPAKAVCQCEVRTNCLEYAFADPYLTGVWGGQSASDRLRLRRATEFR
jgi:hypothetical protein